MTELTISRHLQQMAEKYATKAALAFPAEQLVLSFASVKQLADQTAKALLGIGLKKGDHIGIWSLNSSRWVLLALGAAQIGVVFVPINAAYKQDELAYMVRNIFLLFILGSFLFSILHQTIRVTIPSTMPTTPKITPS